VSAQYDAASECRCAARAARYFFRVSCGKIPELRLRRACGRHLAPDKLAAVRQLAATELASGIFLQQKNGSFKFSRSRVSADRPHQRDRARDLDDDGKLDLLCVGNNFAPGTLHGPL